MITWTEDLISEMHAAMKSGMRLVDYAAKKGVSTSVIRGKSFREFGGWAADNQRLPSRVPKSEKDPPSKYLVYRDGRLLLSYEGRRYLRKTWKNTMLPVRHIANRFGIGVHTVRFFAGELNLGPKPFDMTARKTPEPTGRIVMDPVWPKNVRFTDYPMADAVGRRVFIYVPPVYRAR